jgi:uncharacterized protein YhbP (UPF0306 family)
VNNNLRELIQDYLQEAKLMQLATAIDNQPWTSNVWFVADKDLNIYWFSSTKRRHSREILKNKKVAAAICLPQAPKDILRGLQLEGTAELLTDNISIVKAILLFARKIFTKEQIKQFMKNKKQPHRFYKITPTQFVLFDALNFPDNSRQEYNL